MCVGGGLVFKVPGDRAHLNAATSPSASKFQTNFGEFLITPRESPAISVAQPPTYSGQ